MTWDLNQNDLKFLQVKLQWVSTMTRYLSHGLTDLWLDLGCDWSISLVPGIFQVGPDGPGPVLRQLHVFTATAYEWSCCLKRIGADQQQPKFPPHGCVHFPANLHAAQNSATQKFGIDVIAEHSEVALGHSCNTTQLLKGWVHQCELGNAGSNFAFCPQVLPKGQCPSQHIVQYLIFFHLHFPPSPQKRKNIDQLAILRGISGTLSQGGLFVSYAEISKTSNWFF